MQPDTKKGYSFLEEGQEKVWKHNLQEYERSLKDPDYMPNWMLFKPKRS